MNTAPRIVGNHVWLFRDGDAFTVPTSGTAARESKPGAADTAWIDAGVIEELSVEKTSEQKDVFKPAPGQLRLYDVIDSKHQLNISAKAMEIGALSFELIFGTLALSAASTQYNPLEGLTKKAWVKIQQYGQDDAILNTVDVFCHVSLGGAVAFGADIVTTDLKFRVLHSTLNTGTLVAS